MRIKIAIFVICSTVFSIGIGWFYAFDRGALWTFQLSNLSKSEIPPLGNYVDPIAVTKMIVKSLEKHNLSKNGRPLLYSPFIKFEVVEMSKPIVRAILYDKDETDALNCMQLCESNCTQFIARLADEERQAIMQMSDMNEESIKSRLNLIETLEHAHLESRISLFIKKLGLQSSKL